MRKALNPHKSGKTNNFRKSLVDSKLGTRVEVRKAYDMQGTSTCHDYSIKLNEFHRSGVPVCVP